MDEPQMEVALATGPETGGTPVPPLEQFNALLGDDVFFVPYEWGTKVSSLNPGVKSRSSFPARRFALVGINFVIQSEWRTSETTMKTLARVGAIASFVFFLLPGAWLLLHDNAKNEPLSIIVGSCLAGIAFFAGPMLWLAGERWGSKSDHK